MISLKEQKYHLRKVLTILTVVLLMIIMPSNVLYSQTDTRLDLTKGYFKDQTMYFNDKYITANFYFYWNSYIRLADILEAYPNYTCKAYDNRVDIYKDNVFVKQFSLGNLTSDDGFIYNGHIYLYCGMDTAEVLPVDPRTVPDELDHPEGRYEGKCGTIEIYPDLQWIDLSQYIEGWPRQQVRMAKFDLIYQGKHIKGTYPVARAFEGFIMNPNILYVYIEKGPTDHGMYRMNILESSNGDLKIAFSQSDRYNDETLIRTNSYK